MTITCGHMISSFYTADEDYNTTIVIIDVHPNDTLIAVTVPVINDDIAEGVELFTVAMASMSEFLLTDNSVAIVQIIDSNGGKKLHLLKLCMLHFSLCFRRRFEGWV